MGDDRLWHLLRAYVIVGRLAIYTLVVVMIVFTLAGGGLLPGAVAMGALVARWLGNRHSSLRR